MPRKANHRSPTDIDSHIAERMMAARKQAGISQEAAGVAIGVSFQQVQKYEKGANRVSVGRLYQLARCYGVPMSWFFEGLRDNPAPGSFSDVSIQLLAAPHGAELARSYLAISDRAGRVAVLTTAAAFAGRDAEAA